MFTLYNLKKKKPNIVKFVTVCFNVQDTFNFFFCDFKPKGYGRGIVE